MAKILVSFKEREKKLYELVNSQGDKSNYMKDALKFYLEHNGTKMIKTPAETEVNSSEIMDIIESI